MTCCIPWLCARNWETQQHFFHKVFVCIQENLCVVALYLVSKMVLGLGRSHEGIFVIFHWVDGHWQCYSAVVIDLGALEDAQVVVEGSYHYSLLKLPR